MRTGERKEERGEPAFTAHLPFGSKCLTPVLKVIHFCSPRNNCFLHFPTAELIVKVEFNCPHHPRQDVLYPTLCDSEKSSYVATCIWCKESTSGLWCVPMLWGILCGQLPPPTRRSTALCWIRLGETSLLRRQQPAFASGCFPWQLLVIGESIDAVKAAQRLLTHRKHVDYRILLTRTVFFNIVWKYRERTIQISGGSLWCCVRSEKSG